MKSTKSLVGLVAAMSLLFAQSTPAVPVFQVYIDGATTDAMEPDENTWVITDSAFDLIVSGAYGPWTKSLTEITLLISIPEGETGTISITGSNGATLLTERTAAPDGYFNPDVDAVLDLIENELGNADEYDGYWHKDFFPEGTQFNNHYPFKEDVSNFLLYDLGDFEKASNAVSNYSTEEPIAYNTWSLQAPHRILRRHSKENESKRIVIARSEATRQFMPSVSHTSRQFEPLRLGGSLKRSLGMAKLQKRHIEIVLRDSPGRT